MSGARKCGCSWKSLEELLVNCIMDVRKILLELLVSIYSLYDFGWKIL